MTSEQRDCMDDLKKLGVNTYGKYVDDIFATVYALEQAESCVAFLNSRNVNIKFTYETESNEELPFLDTKYKRVIGKYATTVYHKKAFTGVYLNWTSLTSRKFKIGLIKNLTHRILRICSQPKDVKNELDKLRTQFEKKSYAIEIIKQEMQKTRDKRSKTSTQHYKPETTDKFIALPYVSNKCEQFALKLRKLVKDNIDNVDLNIAWKAPKLSATSFRTRTR